MKVTLVIEIDDDEAKALSFAANQGGKGSRISKDLALREDPRKTTINRDGIQRILTHMVNFNIRQCVQVFAYAVNNYGTEQAVVKSLINKPNK